MTSQTHDPYPARTDILQPSDLAPGLHTARLANGLRVIIREDHRAGVAVCNVWVRVGSNREPEPLRGWSHGIEHMLFKGTAGRGEGDFAREVAEAGGSTNAGTGYETTNYHITVPGENLPVAVDILADAVFHSRFDPASLDAERQVLVHENHMYDDIPFGFGVTWRWGCELAFDVSPYQHPIGGRDENLLERDRDEILAFWRSAYRPANMSVVIVGAVEPAQAFDLVRQRFGTVDPALFAGTDAGPCAIVAAPPVEGDHDGPRLRIEYGDIKKAYAKLIFPAPGERSGLDPILSVVRRVLSDGRSCRLYRRIQEERQLVDDIALLTETGPREGLLLVDMETGAERLAAALTETAAVLAGLGRDGCSEVELERAITRVSRSYLFGAETVQGQAANLGRNDVNDDLGGAFSFPDQVAAVTTADVARFCRSVFRLENASLVLYLPAGTDPAACGLPTDTAAVQRLLGKVLPQGASGPVPVPATAASGRGQAKTAGASGAAVRFETAHLRNGIEVCCRVDRALPIMTMSLARAGGATAESAADAGLSSLTQMVLVKGAGPYDAEALHGILEGEGASLSPQADRDYAGLYLSALSGRLDRAFELLGLTIREPAFAEAEIAQEKRLALEQLASVEDNPIQAAALRLRHLLYGDHPYGRPQPGTTTSIPAHTRDALTGRHRANWVTGGLQVVVAGDVEPGDIVARLEDLLGDLPAGAPTTPAPGPVRAPDGVRHERMVRQQNQGVVLVAWPGSTDVARDRIPLMLLKEVLNGQSGRLFETLRNRQSLCYNTGSMSTAGFGQGFFMGYVLTAPDTMDRARDALVAEIRGMGAATVAAAEFERARSKLLGNMLIGSQSNSARVMRAARDRIYGRDANDLENVIEQVRTCRADAVRAVAERLFSDEARYEVFLGPS